jgi:hypothetical protein
MRKFFLTVWKESLNNDSQEFHQRKESLNNDSQEFNQRKESLNNDSQQQGHLL